MPDSFDLEVNWSNESQREFYFARERNQLISGGFNSGKTYGLCLKAFTLLATYNTYRASINRQVRADLMKTTYPTFFKICPREFVEAQNLQEGFTILKNNSRIDWLHLDGVEESTLRGLEINSNFTDQAEEVEEKAYDILNVRIGRWDKAEVPKELLDAFPEWPRNVLTRKPIVPSYNCNTCNPETEFHHLFRHYHPESLERKKNHFFVEVEWDPKLGSHEAYEEALNQDEEWILQYVKGKWSASKAQIHKFNKNIILEPSDELFEKIHKYGNLYRILDHGDASPTCVLWFANLFGIHICFREYYVPDQLISYHRKAITDLSKGESYSASYADPSIFHKASQKEGGFWSVADEYTTRKIDGPPISWIAADNNEFATRNRINELLRPLESRTNPVTGLAPAEGLYFIKKTEAYPFGCSQSIKQLGSQRRKLIGYYNGKAVYSDEREESVEDHAYDCIRYYVAMHGSARKEEQRKIPRNSIKYYKELLKRKGLPVPASS